MEDPARNIYAKINETQEAVEMYERLNLKQEYIYSYRMLILLLLQAGDFNVLRTEMKKFLITNEESANFDYVMMTKLWNGKNPNNLGQEKGVIIRCGEGTHACGLPKSKVFQSCVVPSLRSFYEVDKPKKMHASLDL